MGPLVGVGDLREQLFVVRILLQFFQKKLDLFGGCLFHLFQQGHLLRTVRNG